MKRGPFPIIALLLLTLAGVMGCSPNSSVQAAPVLPANTGTSVPSVTPSPTITATNTLPTAIPSATPLPAAATSVPATPSDTDNTIITIADNNRTITLQVGQQFALNLGTTLNWNVQVDKPSIVSRMVNILTIKGSQGVFTALAPGQATLQATGDAACRSSKPPCMVPTQMFRLKINVVGESSAATATPASSNAVVYADNGKTITLHMGDNFLLNLGSTFNWTVHVDDPTLVGRVVNIAVIKGAQGVYEAKKTGETNLTATGVVPCEPLKACPDVEVAFKIHVVIQ